MSIRSHPGLALPVEPGGEGLAVAGVGGAGHDGIDQHVGPLGRKDGRRDAVGDDGDAPLRIDLAGVLVLARMLGVFGELEDAQMSEMRSRTFAPSGLALNAAPAPLACPC